MISVDDEPANHETVGILITMASAVLVCGKVQRVLIGSLRKVSCWTKKASYLLGSKK